MKIEQRSIQPPQSITLRGPNNKGNYRFAVVVQVVKSKSVFEVFFSSLVFQFTKGLVGKREANNLNAGKVEYHKAVSVFELSHHKLYHSCC